MKNPQRDRKGRGANELKNNDQWKSKHKHVENQTNKKHMKGVFCFKIFCHTVKSIHIKFLRCILFIFISFSEYYISRIYAIDFFFILFSLQILNFKAAMIPVRYMFMCTSSIRDVFLNNKAKCSSICSVKLEDF